MTLRPNADAEGDTNGDGVFTLRESGDFNKMICGCSASGEVTPPPVPTPTNAPVPGNVRRTQAPVFAGAPTPVRFLSP